MFPFTCKLWPFPITCRCMKRMACQSAGLGLGYISKSESFTWGYKEYFRGNPKKQPKYLLPSSSRVREIPLELSENDLAFNDGWNKAHKHEKAGKHKKIKKNLKAFRRYY